MDWTPTLSDRAGPLYQRIVDVLASDIAEGRLRRGQQLPTHRALAAALDLDLSTVTRAYREARAKGLIDAQVGRGTFVAESLSHARRGAPPWALFDLSMNLPPQPLEADLEGRIARGVSMLAKDVGLSAYLTYREAGGIAEEREAAAAWLKPRLPHADAAQLLIAPGTQCGLTILLAALTQPGDVILTEALTYPGMKAAAAQANVRLVGVSCDQNGILPDALARLIRRHKPKALYLTPTIHNPTAVTMPLARRKEIVRIIRAQGLKLIEDDAYGLLEPEAVPIAALAPELTYFVFSISKCIAPGLRISLLLAPGSEETATLSAGLRAAVQMTPPLLAGLVTGWLSDGSAQAIIAAIRAEAGARQKLAATILSGADYAARPNGHHLWLQLPERWTPAEFVGFVRRQGLAIVGSDAFAVDGTPPNAVRVALGAASSRHELASALGLLVSALRSPPQSARIV